MKADSKKHRTPADRAGVQKKLSDEGCQYTIAREEQPYRRALLKNRPGNFRMIALR